MVDHRKSKGIPRTPISASLTTLKLLTVWITTNWKILKEMGIPDHLTCLLRNLYAGQEATVRTRHGTIDWFQIRKGVHQGCILYIVSVSHCFHCFPICLPWTDGTRCYDLSFLNVFKPTFSLSSFTSIKRLFSSSLSAIRVVSSGYLRLLIFLLAILISSCASFSMAFRMMYSAYKLNKQGNNIHPWHTPFPIWNQSVVPFLVLTVVLDLHTDFSGGR